MILAAFVAMLMAACGNPPSPSPSASPVVTPSSSIVPTGSIPGESPTETACTSNDIHATGGPWGGAAGSRGSDITVVNAGSTACLLPAGPAIALLDQSGAVLLTTPARAGSGPSVAPNGTATFSLLFGNWCAENVNLPLHFRLALASDAVDIENLAASTVDDLPPCNGPGLPASLSTTDWQ